MPKVTLLHNPSAGDEEHAGEYLTQKISAAGYDTHYVSIRDDDWKKFDSTSAFVIAAGGDGTVRKLIKTMLDRDIRVDIGLLPSGTANNVALAMGQKKNADHNIASWKRNETKEIDIGTIEGFTDEDFFVESVGYGLMPALMREMKHADRKHNTDPEKRLEVAQQIFADLAQQYQPRQCQITIDGLDHSGEYIMIEVLNMPYIGPNLRLSPGADAGDGYFDIVLIAADGRQTLIDLLEDRDAVPVLNDGYQIIRGRDVQIQWPDDDIHIDDKRVEAGDQMLRLGIRDKQFRFLI